MTIPKKVSFIERISKSCLGLEGLQKVVYCDRARTGEENIKNKDYDFTTIGRKMLKEVDGEYIKQKYDIEPGKKFGQVLHQERVNWLKKQ